MDEGCIPSLLYLGSPGLCPALEFRVSLRASHTHVLYLFTDYFAFFISSSFLMWNSEPFRVGPVPGCHPEPSVQGRVLNGSTEHCILLKAVICKSIS